MDVQAEVFDSQAKRQGRGQPFNYWSSVELYTKCASCGHDQWVSILARPYDSRLKIVGYRLIDNVCTPPMRAIHILSKWISSVRGGLPTTPDGWNDRCAAAFLVDVMPDRGPRGLDLDEIAHFVQKAVGSGDRNEALLARKYVQSLRQQPDVVYTKVIKAQICSLAHLRKTNQGGLDALYRICAQNDNNIRLHYAWAKYAKRVWGVRKS